LPIVPTYFKSGAYAASTSAPTCAWPTLTQADDIAILVVESENQAISLTTANGFVQLGDQANKAAGAATTDPANRIAVYWKRLVGSDSVPVVADSGNHTSVQIHVFRGCRATGDPWDVWAEGNDGGADDTHPVLPAVTTTVQNTLIVLICGTSYNISSGTSTTEFSSWTNANLTGITERADNANTSGLGGGHGMATGVRAATGDIGTTAVTLAHTSYKGTMVIALVGEDSNGAAEGASTVQAVSGSTAGGVAASAGVATDSVVGAARWLATAAAEGTGAAAGVGGFLLACVGASEGTSDTQTFGDDGLAFASQFVQSATTFGNTGSTSIALAFSVNVQLGSLIAVVVCWDDGAAPVVTVSDNRNGAYTAYTSLKESGSGQDTAFFYVPNTAAGATTVTASFTTTTTWRLLGIMEIAGCLKVNPVVGGISSLLADASSPFNSSSVTTGQTAFLFGALQDVNGTPGTVGVTSSGSGGAPWIIRSAVDRIALASALDVPAGTYAAAFTATAPHLSVTGLMAFGLSAAPTSDTTGSSAGTGVASAVSGATKWVVAAASGSSAASAVPALVGPFSGSSAGTGVASAVSGAAKWVVAAASGSSAVDAVPALVGPFSGSSAGTGVASAVSGATKWVVAAASGVASSAAEIEDAALAGGYVEVTAAGVGQSTASSVSGATKWVVAAASGSSAASAVPALVGPFSGSSAGTGVASTVSGATKWVVAAASGSSAVDAVGRTLRPSVGMAIGASGISGAIEDASRSGRYVEVTAVGLGQSIVSGRYSQIAVSEARSPEAMIVYPPAGATTIVVEPKKTRDVGKPPANLRDWLVVDGRRRMRR